MILEKLKTPGDTPTGVFCFPQGKQKTVLVFQIPGKDTILDIKPCEY